MPSTADNRLKYCSWFKIWAIRTKSSPVPAKPPNSFATCIKIIVQPIPEINPPITGVEM